MVENAYSPVSPSLISLAWLSSCSFSFPLHSHATSSVLLGPMTACTSPSVAPSFDTHEFCPIWDQEDLKLELCSAWFPLWDNDLPVELRAAWVFFRNIQFKLCSSLALYYTQKYTCQCLSLWVFFPSTFPLWSRPCIIGFTSFLAVLGAHAAQCCLRSAYT